MLIVVTYLLPCYFPFLLLSLLNVFIHSLRSKMCFFFIKTNVKMVIFAAPQKQIMNNWPVLDQNLAHNNSLISQF